MACCPLHNHSEYSAIDGVSTPAEIAARAVEIGATSVGLTDHGVVAGHLEFERECHKAGVKPVFGCEFYHGVEFGKKLGNKRDQAHLIALAMTDEGLRNLWRLNTLAATDEKTHHVSRISWDDIERYNEGIVFTSACALSLVCRELMRGRTDALNRYLSILGDRFVIEVPTYPPDAIFDDRDADEGIYVDQLGQALVDVAQERGLMVVYGDDGHYAYPDQYEAHDAYVAKSTGDSIYTPVEDRKMWHPDGALVIKDEATVRANLSYLGDFADEVIANTVELGERADAKTPEVRRHLPVFIPDASPWVERGKYADDESDKLFIDLVTEGLFKHYGEDDVAAGLQTVKEAEIFIEAGLHDYFLVAWDLMQYADQEGIERGPGRGSSAGCIIARLLGITDVDPLKHGLKFERFWNPGRAKGFPDIDSDFAKGGRGALKRYLDQRWGHDRVLSIGTVLRMKPKSLIESLAPVCGIQDDEQRALRNFIDQVPDIDILGVDQIGWDDEHQPGKVVYVMHGTKETPHDVGDQIVSWIEKQPEKRQQILLRFLDHCAVLCNRVSTYGVHPSGIIISDDDLPDKVPSRFVTAKDQRIPVSQFPMDEIEALMYVKLDVLGLRTLDVLADWKRRMRENHGIDINFSQLEHEINDEDMWELMHRGKTAGTFQVEGGFAKRLAEDFQPTSVDDLSIIVALNRPGPIRSGAPDSFIRRRAGDEDVEYDHPFLEDLLEETYGWFLYQEQVINFFSKMGYSESDADAVRKILGKKQPEKWDDLLYGRDEWEGKSYLDACKRNGIDLESAHLIWAKLVDFGKYSFNKAHSVAYGIIGYRTNLAKYFGPSEFLASCIHGVDKSKRAELMPRYINEARGLGIQVFGPDIEFSDVYVATRKGDVYFGFNDVKGIAEQGAKYLVVIRDQQDAPIDTPEELTEFIAGLSKEWSKENAKRKKAGLPPQDGKSPGQQLNSGHIKTLYAAGAWERLEGYPTPLREMQQRETENLHVILSNDVERAFAENAELLEQIEDTYREARMPYPGEDQQFTLPGVITDIREVKTRSEGKKMAIVTMEHDGDELTYAVFPKDWRGARHLWQPMQPVVVTVRHTVNPNTGEAGYNFKSGKVLN